MKDVSTVREFEMSTFKTTPRSRKPPDLQLQNFKGGIAHRWLLEATRDRMLRQRLVLKRGARRRGAGANGAPNPQAKVTAATKGHKVERGGLEEAISAAPAPCAEASLSGPRREEKGLCAREKERECVCVCVRVS